MVENSTKRVLSVPSTGQDLAPWFEDQVAVASSGLFPQPLWIKCSRRARAMGHHNPGLSCCQHLRMWIYGLVLAAIALQADSGAAAAPAELVTEVAKLRFYSAFWPNLHHTLYVAAWDRREGRAGPRRLAGKLPEPLTGNADRGGAGRMGRGGRLLRPRARFAQPALRRSNVPIDQARDDRES